MKAIETTVNVATDGTAILQFPPDIAPGEHQIVIVINDEIDGNSSANIPTKQLPKFPVIHVGAWTEVGSLRREDLYGDNGR
jgi:hypothetical protein